MKRHLLPGMYKKTSGNTTVMLGPCIYLYNFVCIYIYIHLQVRYVTLLQHVTTGDNKCRMMKTKSTPQRLVLASIPIYKNHITNHMYYDVLYTVHMYICICIYIYIYPHPCSPRVWKNLPHEISYLSACCPLPVACCVEISCLLTKGQQQL